LRPLPHGQGSFRPGSAVTDAVRDRDRKKGIPRNSQAGYRKRSETASAPTQRPASLEPAGLEGVFTLKPNCELLGVKNRPLKATGGLGETENWHR
jgi:hypothetical protein